MANKQIQREKHFVLVHGVCHGAWCWYRVATLLKSSGHKVTALDMAPSGVHSKQPQDVNSIVEYVEPLMEFLGGLGERERVVLVGHSLGGVVLSTAMERFPEKIAVAVFAAAFMPGPDFTYHSILEEHSRRVEYDMGPLYRFDDGPDKPPTYIMFEDNFLASNWSINSPHLRCQVRTHLAIFLHCLKDVTLASYLGRPFRLYPDQDKMKEEMAVTKGRYGLVRRVYIVCDQDLLIISGLQRWMVEMNPPDEVKVISGSDHMVMFSKPQELCASVEEIGQHYCS